MTRRLLISLHGKSRPGLYFNTRRALITPYQLSILSTLPVSFKLKCIFFAFFLNGTILKKVCLSFFSIFRPYEGHIEDSTEMRNQYQDHGGGHLDQPLKTRGHIFIKYHASERTFPPKFGPKSIYVNI